MDGISNGTQRQLSCSPETQSILGLKQPRNQSGTGLSPSSLLPEHWAELQASAIALDVAVANVASWGPGTNRHWESERAELLSHARLQIQTSSTTASGLPQVQPGYLADRLIALDCRYRHFRTGGWVTLSDTLPGLPAYRQWKPNIPRTKGKWNPRTGAWRPVLDEQGRATAIKYEAQPQAPDGGGALLPNVPERCWQLICNRHGLTMPAPDTPSHGFWAWALTTPELPLLICEGWKKALAAISAGWAAVALPGVQMGRRVAGDGSEQLIPALRLLTTPGRLWLITFDAEAKPKTAGKVAAAAGALARTLRTAGGKPQIIRLPLLDGTKKTGLDDLLATAGPEALDRALSNTGPQPVLPVLRAADRVAAAGAYLGEAYPLPAPAVAPLLLLQAPMGVGKTEAIAAAVAPLQAAGLPVLLPSHRVALGQALAERLGVNWAPAPGSDERQLGAGFCLDSACPSSALKISGHGWNGGVLVWDEIAQGLEHLLLGNGTALADRRGEVLRTLSELVSRAGQLIAADAQLPQWALVLLERLTGRHALLVSSEHKPMAGRIFYAPSFKTSAEASDAFRAQWAELVASKKPFLCWTSAQQAGRLNAPQTLAALHRQRVPGARIAVIDSTTPELAADLAADPDAFAERFDAIYCSPAISSGVSFKNWRPAAVIIYAGGHIAPEHVAQAAARVRCPDVPAYIFASEICPGSALRVGSGHTKPAELIRHLQGVSDPLLGQLEEGGSDGAWLQAWAELGAYRNLQRFAYAASIKGLLVREGWELQLRRHAPCPAAGAQAAADLKAIAEAALAAEDQAVINALPLTDQEAQALTKRRQVEPVERAALARHRLDKRWGLEGAPPTQALIEADRNGLRDQLWLGWLLTTPRALGLVPDHDAAAVMALDPTGRPFAPDRLRVALAPRLAVLQLLGTADRPRVLMELLQRFASGETIAANDPAVAALHDAAIANRHALTTAAGVSPRKLPTGTLRTLLEACGWKLVKVGRIKARGEGRDAYTYQAQPLQVPEGVNPDALAAVWLSELEAPDGGAKKFPIGISYRGEKSPRGHQTLHLPSAMQWPLAEVVAISWPATPPPSRSAPLPVAC